MLGKLCSSHDSKLQWLLEHAASLQKLCLIDCSILREAFFVGQQDDDGYPVGRIGGDGHQRVYIYERHWHYYFGEITSSLYRLTQFVTHSRKALKVPSSSWKGLSSSLSDERTYDSLPTERSGIAQHIGPQLLI